MIVKAEIDIDVWLDEEGFHVFVGDQDDPVATYSLGHLVKQHLCSTCIPATLTPENFDIKKIQTGGGHVKKNLQLQEQLIRMAHLVGRTIEKSVD